MKGWGSACFGGNLPKDGTDHAADGLPEEKKKNFA